MPLVKLTDLHNSNKPIYINPNEVISVQDVGGQTWVTTTATGPNGASRHTVVGQTAEEVARLLDASMSRAT